MPRKPAKLPAQGEPYSPRKQPLTNEVIPIANGMSKTRARERPAPGCGFHISDNQWRSVKQVLKKAKPTVTTCLVGRSHPPIAVEPLFSWKQKCFSITAPRPYVRGGGGRTRASRSTLTIRPPEFFWRYDGLQDRAESRSVKKESRSRLRGGPFILMV